jgi:tetratricopeptide (TPR) repeat protein
VDQFQQQQQQRKQFHLLVQPEDSQVFETPENTNKRLELAVQETLELQRSNKVQEAIRAYLRILLVDPHQLDAMHLLGVAFYQQNDFVRAEKLLTQAIQVAETKQMTSGLYFANRGSLYEATGKVEQALRDVSFCFFISDSSFIRILMLTTLL